MSHNYQKFVSVFFRNPKNTKKYKKMNVSFFSRKLLQIGRFDDFVHFENFELYSEMDD